MDAGADDPGQERPPVGPDAGPPQDGAGAPPAGPAEPPGRVARMGAGIRRARTRAEEAKRRGIEIAERERGRRPSVAAAYELGHRDRQAAGALLAGGLAFRFF